MNDLIYRQAAIDALGDEPEVWTGKDEYAQGLNNQWHYDKNAILAVPSAETKRMKGRWQEVYAETDYRNGWIEFSCECCEYQHGLESGEYGWHYGDEIPWKYCPLCGADMRGEQDERN